MLINQVAASGFAGTEELFPLELGAAELTGAELDTGAALDIGAKLETATELAAELTGTGPVLVVELAALLGVVPPFPQATPL